MNRSWWDLPTTTIVLGIVLIEPLPIALHFSRFDDRQLGILMMLALVGAGMIVFGFLELLRGLRPSKVEATRMKITRNQVIEALVVMAFIVWLAAAVWPHLVSAWEAASP
jgi:threonine dehydrogenase-like Zn-dependent dehydrogenase